MTAETLEALAARVEAGEARSERRLAAILRAIAAERGDA